MMAGMVARMVVGMVAEMVDLVDLVASDCGWTFL